MVHRSISPGIAASALPSSFVTEAATRHAEGVPHARGSGQRSELVIPLEGVQLHGVLYAPAHPSGVVVFVHESGVAPDDARQQDLARQLQRAGLAAVTIDLLDADETRERHNVFDGDLQAERLLGVAHWLRGARRTAHLALGYYAVGVGAAAAVIAAVREPEWARAMVLHNGCADAAAFWLSRVTVPTLLIVDPQQPRAWQRTQDIHARLGAEKAMAAVAEMDERHAPRGQDEVARHASQWFSRHLPGAAGGTAGKSSATDDALAAGRAARAVARTRASS